MRPGFTKKVFQSLMDDGLVSSNDRVLSVCAGEMDAELFRLLDFEDAVCTNIDVEHGVTPETRGGTIDGSAEQSWLPADAQDLPFDPDSFDVAFVADGLHHCRSPHTALTEMLRVATRGVLVVESRESLLLRIALRAGLAADYEINERLLATRTRGGADFGAVPNFVFRWTEKEFEKTVRCFEPEWSFDFRYFYGMSTPAGSGLKGSAIQAASGLTERFTPRQGNLFAMWAGRSALQPFLEEVDGSARLKSEIRSADETRARGDRHGIAKRSRETIRVKDFWEGWPAASRDRLAAASGE